MFSCPLNLSLSEYSTIAPQFIVVSEMNDRVSNRFNGFDPQPGGAKKEKSMLHSHTKIFVHLVWATKNRERILRREARPLVQEHIAAYAKDNRIIVPAVNVQIDHVHTLLNLQSDQKLEDIARVLKGESSHWINEKNMLFQKFCWQRGYGAFSVSPSHFGAVKNYINTQDEHHREMTFAEEYKTLMRKYGFATV